MSAYPSRIASFPVFFALAIVTLAVSLPAQAAAPASTAQASSQYGRLPLSFELNQGQADSHIKFFSHGRANAMFFTDNEAVLNLQAPRQEHSLAVKGDVLRLSLVGARAKQVVGEGKLAGKVNYLQSPVAGRPVVNVPLYSRVKYEAAYPGVDLVYYGNGKQLEYDFQVAPRADSRQIKLKIEGAQGLKLAADGSLIVQGKYGSVRWKKPVAYQEYLDTGKVEIASKYVLHGNEVSFEIGPYNHNGLLVIDPTLVYSTYVGGNDNSSCCSSSHAIAVDNMGAAYIAGVTVQADYPATPGAYDSQQKSNGSFGFAQGFVTKLNLDGSGIVYSTYLTGSANASGIAVDSIGDAYVVGVASNNVTTSGASYSFNTTPGAFRSMDNRLSAAFVLKLSPNGASATYSTVIGSLQGGFTGGIALNTTDASSNPQAYITGYAAGADFPITANAFQQSNAGNYDAFVTAVNGDGSNLVYSTWLGGGADQSKFSNLTGEDQGTGITVRPNGDAIVTGFTRSDNFPQTNTQYSQIAQTGNSDIFVTELNPSGSALVFSTLIGGPYDDEGNSITLDPGGNIYVGGGTEGGNFPMLDNSYRKYSNNTHDGVLFELSADGQSLLASTFLGGTGIDEVNGVAVGQQSDGVFVNAVGTTRSQDFPVTPDAFQSTNNAPSASNAFYSKLDAALSTLSYSTYFGAASSGSGPTAGNTGNGIALDSNSNAYITGASAQGLPTTSNAYKSTAPSNTTLPYAAKFSGDGATPGDCSQGDVNISSPVEGYIGPSPVHFQATATSGCPITALQIYQDNVLVYQTASSTLDTYLTVPQGQHYMVVQAFNSNGNWFKRSRDITITSPGGNGGCTAGPGTVHLCLPTNGSSDPTPVEFSGAGNMPNETLLRLYIDDQPVFETAAQSFDTTIDLGAGNHHAVLVGYDNTCCDAQIDQSYFSVTGTGSVGCGTPSTDMTILICYPGEGQTVSSPFQLQARARWDGNAISHMRVYVDDQPAYDQDYPPEGYIDPQLTLGTGWHRIVIVAWNNAGASIVSPTRNVNVQ